MTRSPDPSLALPDIPGEWFVRIDGTDHSAGIHGCGHTLRVWTHATELARELGLPQWQSEAIHYAALWHDIGRIDDGADYTNVPGAAVARRSRAARRVDPIVVRPLSSRSTQPLRVEEHAEARSVPARSRGF